MNSNTIPDFPSFNKDTTLVYKTSEGNYGYMKITSASATGIDFFWHTLGVNNGENKIDFEKGWGFDLDGQTTDNNNKDFGLDNQTEFKPHNGAKFHKLP